ncbi:MAG: MAPEG family protein [Xanthomonadales bacterium]|nr:MAPEG family protein [Xanthomonadales bacterium]
MTPELTYLAWISLFTAVMWVPYILNMITVRGLADAVGYPDNPKPLAPWAERMKRAHANAVENLVVFAALVLAAHLAGVSNEITVMASMIYFWARVLHFASFAFAIPWIRTLTFVTGSACQVLIGLQILK